MWLVSGNANADPYNYSGPLYNKSGGQTLYGNYVPPGNETNTVGTLTAHFTDDTHGTITWPGGTVAIQRHIFGTGQAAFQPVTGWWWNPDESGSGYSVEVQGNSLFIVGFMYETSGRPVWYFSAGPMSSDKTFHGTVFQYANGQTIGGAYHPPGTPAAIATLDVTFKAENEAEFTFTELSASAEGDPQPRAGKTSTKKLRPEFPYIQPETFTGNFTTDGTAHSVRTPETADGAARARYDIVWVHDPPDALPNRYEYKLSHGNVTATITSMSKVVTPDITVTCTISGSGSAPLSPNTSILEVFENRKYLLYLHFDQNAFTFPATGECVTSDGDRLPLVSPTVGTFLTDFTYEGVVVGDTIAGGGTKTETFPTGSATTTYSWNFKAFRP
jgi:hypothetical protein